MHLPLRHVREKIEEATTQAHRNPSEVTLVAVSKTFPASEIIPVLEDGQRVFGENRVQEAQKKWPLLKERFRDISLHLIGPLQSNKVASAVGFFDVIETVDREKIARLIADEIKKQKKSLELFIQVNIGEEKQKSGILPNQFSDFLAFCKALHLPISGIMAIPPEGKDPLPFFAHLKNLQTTHNLGYLSMGMSGDFEEAITLGATHVRVGSLIFGKR